MPELSISEFADKIDELMPAVMRGFARCQNNELFKGKITLPQFFILSYLEKHSEAIMKDLAKVMDVTTAAATGIVDRLVRCGYIVRSYDPKDRRVIHVRLTGKGLELVRKMRTQRKQLTIDVFGRISKEERTSYLSILAHIRDVLQEERDNS